MGVYIIAEAGVNHNGSLQTALSLVDAAVEAGADAVKFQTFTAERLVRRNAPKADYQKQTTGSDETQYEMLSRLELSIPAHEHLLKYCIERGIDFLSTPFDEASLDFLTDNLGLKRIKLGSGEVTNGPLLLHAARKSVDVILSTGMSTLGEVEMALSCLAFGYIKSDEPPSINRFLAAYASLEGQKELKCHTKLLHCTSEYPAPFDEVNLRSIVTLKKAFDLSVGYSDHTEGIIISIAAVALGATVIEKHFTLDRSLPGPDHKASLEPGELADLVCSVRRTEEALGSELKIPSPAEWSNRNIVRKSLVAKRSIPSGAEFTEANICAKRPANGISPFEYWNILGRKSPFDIVEDGEITL